MQSGVKAFVVYNKKILLVLRENKPNIRNPNKWGFPGGGIDENESDIEALKRELKEEINLVPNNIVYLGKQKHKDGSYVSRYLVRLSKDEERQLKIISEGQKMEFYGLEKIINLEISDASKKYLSTNTKNIRAMIEEDKKFTANDLGLV